MTIIYTMLMLQQAGNLSRIIHLKCVFVPFKTQYYNCFVCGLILWTYTVNFQVPKKLVYI